MGACLIIGRGVALGIMVFAFVGVLFSLSPQGFSMEDAPAKTYTKAFCTEKDKMRWCEDMHIALVEGKELVLDSPVTGAAFVA